MILRVGTKTKRGAPHRNEMFAFGLAVQRMIRTQPDIEIVSVGRQLIGNVRVRVPEPPQELEVTFAFLGRGRGGLRVELMAGAVFTG